MPVQDGRPLALAVASIFSFSVTLTHPCGLLAISETTRSPVDPSMCLEWEIMCETLFTSRGSQGQRGWCVREKVWWTDRCRPRRQDQLLKQDRFHRNCLKEAAVFSNWHMEHGVRRTPGGWSIFRRPRCCGFYPWSDCGRSSRNSGVCWTIDQVGLF